MSSDQFFFDSNGYLTKIERARNPTIGSITYGYDPDDRLTSESGSLASLKLPLSTNSVTYTATNQVSNWNGTATSYYAASNLTVDPSNAATLTWDERNFISSVSGGPAGSFSLQYDANGRRENDTAAFTGINYYLDDKTTAVVSKNVIGQTTTTYDYETVLGSGEVVGLISSGSTLVPLHDIFGSTLGLVGSSNTLQTQWSYEPFGQPTLSGTQSSFPFLFGGGQYDPTGYYGDYSPRLQHSLSGGGEPYTGSQPGVASHASSGQGGGGEPGALRYGILGANAADTLWFVAAALAPEAPLVAIATAIGAAIGTILDAIFGGDLFGGGGQSSPPLRPYDLAATHQPEAQQIGIVPSLAPNQSLPQYPKMKCPCPPVPEAPPGVSVDENIAEIQSVDSLATWATMVWPKGAWDYKRKGYKYDNFANFNYGATGAACGVPDYILVSTGGLAQAFPPSTHLPGTGIPFLTPPNYGSSKATEIRAGEQYFKCGCNK